MRKIWIDILTPKQFWLFTNLSDRLKSSGFETILTTRRYEQVTPLVEASGRGDVITVGEYGGGSLVGKLRRSLERALNLMEIVEAGSPAASISSGSPEASRIAYGLGIPHILVSDTPDSPVNKLVAPISQLVMTPWVVGRKLWKRYGLPDRLIRTYRGLDPIAWLEGFQPDRSVLELNRLEEKRYVLVRSPEYKAAYLAGKVDLEEYARFCQRLADVCRGYEVVVLPRYTDEAQFLMDRVGDQARVLPKPVYGPSIIYFSAILVGGGGTMTQEAALLGVPTVSFFPSQLPPPIRYLARRGLVNVARNLDEAIHAVRIMLADVSALRVRQGRKALKTAGGMKNPTNEIAQAIEKLLR